MVLSSLMILASVIAAPPDGPPFRQPQLAAANGQLAMTFGAGKSIYFATSADQGRTFGPPVKVAEVGALALGRHRGPRLAILKDVMVISAVVGEQTAAGPHAHGLPEAGDLLTWRSTDRGKTWIRGGPINDVAGAAREGLHAMVAGADGKLVSVWLDLRSKGTTLAISTSRDGGVTWSKNEVAYASPDGTICQCCHPSLAVEDIGRIWVMWRNVRDGCRDLYLASSVDGKRFEEAQKLGEGTWKLDACPMDGGGFVLTRDGPTSAWRRDGEIFVQVPGRKEEVAGKGKDVAVARGRAGVFLAWSIGGGLVVKSPGASAPRPLSEAGAFVNLTTLEDGSVMAAWESEKGIETKRLE